MDEKQRRCADLALQIETLGLGVVVNAKRPEARAAMEATLIEVLRATAERPAPDATLTDQVNIILCENSAWVAMPNRDVAAQIALAALIAAHTIIAKEQEEFDLTPFERRVLAERRRQQTVEGWTPEHDDKHRKGEMARAGACYALASCGFSETAMKYWPMSWATRWLKSTTPTRDLEKAGALILAEGERIERAAAKGGDA